MHRTARQTPARTGRTLGLLLAGGLASGAAAGDFVYRTVAKSGDVAPGVPGATFTGFGIPSINASGQVAFTAASTGQLASTGMWATKFDLPQSLELIAGADLQVPGEPAGTRYGAFDFSYYHPLLNDDGDVGFSGRVIGTTGSSVFRRIDGVVEAVAIPGHAAPGAAPGVVFESLGNLVSFNAGGLMAIRASLSGPGVTAANDFAVYMHWFGGLTQVLREGQAAPGLPGTTYGDTSIPSVQIADNGRIALTLGLNGAQSAGWSVWSGWPGAMEMHARQGDPSPSGNPFLGSPGGFWQLCQTTSGTTFRSAIDVGGDWRSGFWHASGGGVETMAVVGGLGPIGLYESIDAYGGGASADGNTLFRANFDWPGLSALLDSAIVSRRPGQGAAVLAREGDAAWGYWANVAFDELGSGSIDGAAALNDAGDVVFLAKVRGDSVTPDNDRGLFCRSAEGTGMLAFREGQLFSVGDGILRQITWIVFDSSIGTHAGRRPALNERGDIAVRLHFSDGTQAIVVAQPAPSCPGDLDHDGDVDFSDLLIVLAQWGQGAPVGEGGDADLDGDTDFDDLLVVLVHWGDKCG